jgi:hypothetical protein
MYQLIVFLPLIGALIAGLAGTKVFTNLGRDADVYGDPRPMPRTLIMTTMAIMTARPGPCISTGFCVSPSCPGSSFWLPA